MSTEMDTTQKLVSAFKRQKCWMIAPLAEQINYSIPSARCFLAQIGYYSSFTHNGRWYTLSSIPRFKQDGLWFHRKIGFSREGSLTRTLVRMIEQLAKTISRRTGVLIKHEQVQRLFEQHDLKKKA